MFYHPSDSVIDLFVYVTSNFNSIELLKKIEPVLLIYIYIYIYIDSYFPYIWKAKHLEDTGKTTR